MFRNFTARARLDERRVGVLPFLTHDREPVPTSRSSYGPAFWALGVPPNTDGQDSRGHPCKCRSGAPLRYSLATMPASGYLLLGPAAKASQRQRPSFARVPPLTASVPQTPSGAMTVGEDWSPKPLAFRRATGARLP